MFTYKCRFMGGFEKTYFSLNTVVLNSTFLVASFFSDVHNEKLALDFVIFNCRNKYSTKNKYSTETNNIQFNLIFSFSSGKS